MRIGVLILIDRMSWRGKMIHDCVRNVGVAAVTLTSSKPDEIAARETDIPLPYCLMKPDELKVDVILGFHYEIMMSDRLALNDSLSHLAGIASVTLSPVWRDEDMHLRSFLDQLDGTRAFTHVLKLQTKVPRKLLHHSIQCLCSTPSNVISILQEFILKQSIALIAPLGVTIQKSTRTGHIVPALIGEMAKFNYSEQDVEVLNRFITPRRQPVTLESAMSVRGEMYWIRTLILYERLEDIQKAIFLSDAAVQSYNRISHALTLLVPSVVTDANHAVHEMTPAPKPMAIYFPQYHQIPENDRFWGEGFTEWTLLKPLTLPNIMKPISTEEGGLGYYNLTHLSTRQKQASLNREFGGYGFMYYHYWFSGEGTPVDHKVMYKIPELMLLDGEPNAPFMLSWANEPWTKRWAGNGEVLLSQDYGGESEWVEHFNYLLPFFEHPNYIKTVDYKPIFALYRAGHLNDTLAPMLKLWHKLARQNGFPNGIKAIYTMNSFSVWEMKRFYGLGIIEGALQFCPMLRRPHLHDPFGKDVKHRGPQPQYWCSATGFDRRPRDTSTKPQYKVTPIEFWKTLAGDMTNNCNSDVSRWGKLSENLIFITAWNEWNEQAILEPNDLYGNGYLTALRSAMQSVESCPLRSMRE